MEVTNVALPPELPARLRIGRQDRQAPLAQTPLAPAEVLCHRQRAPEMEDQEVVWDHR